MTVARAFALAAALLVPVLVHAQWAWIDKDGRRVFSDRAPPADVPPNKIVRQPGARAAGAADPAAVPGATAAPAAAAAAAQPASGGLRVSTTDKALLEKRKQQEAAAAEQKKAEEAKVAAVRAENCENHRKAKLQFDSGFRIATVNAKGEREYMDDKKRAEEVARLAALIGRDCVAAQ
ncbi:DUF4124 domain-containing protein [Ramlibacter sp.]|uniref:DUF4124 domain-containing protein n=1 Tax=Ramlibacter sp. TaxID=1917967 RepID=UPI003D12CE0C